MTERLVEKLAASVPSWGARIAYGEKSTVGGQDIVPVAVVAFGFGAGEGSGETPTTEKLPQGKGEGSGGGGGGIALPIGAYLSTPSGTVFKPNAIALVLAVTPIVMSVAAAIAGMYAVQSAAKVGTRFAGAAENFAPLRVFGARRSR